MSKNKLEKLASKMKDLSDLQDQILSLIDKYNLLSLEIDNSSRFALLVGESGKDEYFLSGSPNCNQDSIILTHEQFAKDECRPSLSIISKSADVWFPSQFC